MKSSSITLISFASEFHSTSIAKILFRLGYIVNVVKVPGLKYISDNINKGISVFLFGESSPLSGKICTLLSKTNTTACLGIFIREHTDLDADLTHHLNEFLSWPCSDGELELRLEKLGYHVPNIKYSEADKILLDELIHLNIVGQSPALLKTIYNIKKFTRCHAPLLIEGETGTGKELAARAVHYLSSRRDHPFIPVNCGALPENLVENELFGHEKGAFTDAGKSSQGLIAQAERGTLFLDEIEALSQKAQVSLLRFLQESEYRPLGGSQSYKANVKVIAASNASLQNLVKSGSFREDLFYRLNVMIIVMPPLRERGEDAGLIAEHFLSTYRSQYNQPEKIFHPSSLKWLKQYHWPGNVRELENMVHRAFLLSEGSDVYLDGIPEIQSSDSAKEFEESRLHRKTEFSHAKKQAITQFEKRYLNKALKESEGNITLAARRAGKERRAFGKLLKKYGINNTL